MMASLADFFLVMLGGGLGSAIRYGLGQWLSGLVSGGFPYATLGVNVLGCFFMGLLLGWLSRSGMMHYDATGVAFSATGRSLYVLLAIGLLGGWTTFSMFAWDLHGLLLAHAYAYALAYIAGSVLLSFGALFFGLWVVRA